MKVQLDAAKMLVYRAAWLLDRVRNVSMEAAIAKLFVSESLVRGALDAVQIHGGAGYTTEFPVARYFRDARITEIYEGTTEIQHLVIARNLFGS